MDKFDEDDFLPDAEEREKDPYRFSSLGGWFELDTWEEKEAACLICNIDPSTADIKWFGDVQSKSDNLILISARYLVQDASSSVDRSEIDFKKVMMPFTEMLLRKYWRIYLRATDRPGDFGSATPVEYVTWAESRGFEVPWLQWAIDQGLLPDIYAESEADSSDKDQISAAPPPMMTREKNTLLTLVAALLHELDIDPNKRGITKKVEGITEDFGAPIGSQTIKKVLKGLADAVETRQKL